jgi:hypothetical protein
MSAPSRRSDKLAAMKTQPLSLFSGRELRRNCLLAVKPDDALQRLSPRLEAIKLTMDEELYEPDVVLNQLYFPTDSIVTIKAEPHHAEYKLTGAVMRLLLNAQSLIAQIAKTAVCNCRHLLERQLCRWLLLILDRVPGKELTITQEAIAGLLGVRREGITEAASALQRLGLIRYSRGHISLLDRAGVWGPGPSSAMRW